MSILNGLFNRFCWEDSALFISTTQLFFDLPSHAPCSLLKIFLSLLTSAISSTANSNNRIPCHALDQNLFSMESLLVSKQPSFTCFLFKMNVGSFFTNQSKLNDIHRYGGYCFTTRVSQVYVKTMKKFF